MQTNHPFKLKTLSPLAAAMVGALFLSGCGGDTEEQINSHMEKAQAHFEAGELNANIIELKNALKKDPGHAQARWLLGKTYIDMEQGPAAIKELRKALELGAEPNAVFADLVEAMLLSAKYQDALDQIAAASPEIDQDLRRTLSGRAYLGLKEFETAEKSFRAVLDKDANNVEAHLGLAASFTGRNRQQDAIDELEKILVIEPNHTKALSLLGELQLLQQDLAGASNSFEKLIQQGGKGQLAGYLGLARARFAQNDVDGAEELVKKARAISADNPLAMYLTAVIYYQRKDFKNARQYLEDVLKTNPNHPQSLLLSGSIAFAEGRTALAEENLRRYLKMDPGHLPARKLLAAIQLKNEQFREAIRTLEAGLGNGQEDAQYLAMLGNAYMRSGDQSRGAAALEKAVALAPDAAGIKTQLAISHLISGSSEAAVAELEDAVGLGSNLIQADTLLTMTRLKAKNFDGARKLAENMVDKYPQQPVPHNLLGAAMLGQQDMEGAKQQFREALKLDKAFTPASLNLAKLEARDGNRDQAIEVMRTALVQDPNNESLLIGLSQYADQSGDVAKAEEYLQQARSNNPTAVASRVLLGNYYLGTGKTPEAREIAEELEAMDKVDPRSLLYIGRVEETIGNLNVAEKTYQKLTDVAPTFAEGWLRLANAQAKSGDNRGARYSLDKLLDLYEGKNAFALYGLGKLSLQEKDLSGARGYAKRLAEQFPDDPQGPALKALILEADNDLDAAASLREQILKDQPTSANMMRLMQTYRLQGNTDKGRKLLQQWAADHPEDQNAQMALAANAQLKGSDDEAMQSYMKMLEANPNNAAVLNNIAWIYYDQGDPRAVEYAERALAADPANAAIKDTLGWLQVQSGETQQGLRLLEQAVQGMPHNAEIRYHYAAALHRSGDRRNAYRELQKVMESSQQFEARVDAEALLRKLQ